MLGGAALTALLFSRYVADSVAAALGANWLVNEQVDPTPRGPVPHPCVVVGTRGRAVVLPVPVNAGEEKVSPVVPELVMLNNCVSLVVVMPTMPKE
jgi:hypothetical protein